MATKNQMLLLEELIQLDIDFGNDLDVNSYREEAIEKLNKMISLGWDTIETYNNLAVLYEKLGELSKAENILEEMEQKYGEDYRVYKRYA